MNVRWKLMCRSCEKEMFSRHDPFNDLWFLSCEECKVHEHVVNQEKLEKKYDDVFYAELHVPKSLE